jgi:uncharacterized protein YfaS (alpha-2-macroglobulin family)
MRLIVAFIIVFTISTKSVMAQFNYDAHWKKVQELDNQGLPKSVMDEVNVIYKNALQQKNDVQLLKTLIYRIRFVNYKDEGPAKTDNLETSDEQHIVFTPPTRAILQSLRAELLWNYLQQNRYSMYSRTAIAGDTSTDITTWPIDRFTKEIRLAYDASLKDAALLKKVNVADYDAIIEKGNSTRDLRPTLYDLLVHRALDYYKSGESTLRQASNQFELLDPAAFAPAAAFAAHHFTTTDTAALQYKALLLLQDLLQFHEREKAAQLAVDLERIAYMNDVAVMADKQALYVQLLQQMQQAYAGQKEVTQVYYNLALYYQEIGNGTANVGDLTPSTAMKQAVTLCEQAVTLAPGSVGSYRCGELLRSIRSKALFIKSELVNVPDEAFRTLITYKNVNKVYFRIAKIDDLFRRQLQDQLSSNGDYELRQKKYWDLVLGRKTQQAWDVSLPGIADYRNHTAEAKIDALPLGMYMLVASINPSFEKVQNIVSIQFLHVSNLSYIERAGQKGDKLVYVLNRKTGAPIPDVKLNVYTQGNTRSKDVVSQSAVTGKDGAASLKKSKQQYANIRYELIAGTDTLAPDQYEYSYNYDYYNDKPEKAVNQTFLFTDRAIYRPGQIVYFKGIVISPADSTDYSRKAVAGQKVKVHLQDVNAQRVDSMELTTSEYGAYSGKFRLPQHLLNGAFTIRQADNNNSVSFNVEEYKRPKFYVAFDTLKGSYRLNDNVTVNGKALAYAGNNIDGAKVKYRVTREARFPYFWMFRFAPAYSSSREIASGETVTGADGTFKVSFPALPDLTVRPADMPIFTYRIEADITDLNGETRTGNQQLSVGYQAMEITIGVPERASLKELKQVYIKTANLNGAFEPADVNVSVKPLQHPGRLLRARYWEKPDQFTMTREEYEKAFPHDIYNDEDDQKTWARGNAIFSKQLKTTETGEVALDTKSLVPGLYEMEVSSTDKFGQKVIQKATFEAVDTVAIRLPYPTYSWNYPANQSYAPGETAHFLLGSSAPDLHVIEVTNSNQQKLPVISSFTNKNGVTDRKYDVKESDRGNVAIQYAFVKDNRLYTVSRYVFVPWSNKELQVTVASHRDKILPGAKEEWKVAIKGDKKDKVSAELLATMYDASLDAFAPHSWSVPGLYPTVVNTADWSGSTNFRIQEGTLYNNITEEAGMYVSEPDYDRFDWDEVMSEGASVINFEEGSGLTLVKVTGYERGRGRLVRSFGIMKKEARNMAMPAPAMAAAPVMAEAAMDMAKPGGMLMGRAPGVAIEQAKMEEVPDPLKQETPAEQPKVTPRTNLNETAFFLPDLHTDENGNITFSFNVPEALTKWNFLSLAHTKDAKFGYAQSTVITQKPLMVQPNAPRFMREGDKIIFSAKISNLADSALTGEARLELLDAATMKPVDGWFQNVYPAQHFTVQKGQSTAVTFPLEIPYKFNSSLLYRVVASAGNYSDGEENALPVLTNSMLVTETLPLSMRGDGDKKFNFSKLIHSDSSETLQQHALTVEYTGNPAWYAVQALPYLMEYPYECSEQVFNRYYANTLATYIVNTLPGIKSMFEKWRTTDTAALLSNLQKNEELKSVLLQETPWVLEAKSEAEQKRNIALLFDLAKMGDEQAKALEQLRQKQLPGGAFPWFKGMWEDQFITQYILAGIGRLQQVGALNNDKTRDVAATIVDNGLAYVDKQIDEQYKSLKRLKVDMTKQHIGYQESHYLYMRSLLNKPLDSKYNEAYQYYIGQAKKYWLQQSTYTQAMLAIVLKDKAIIRSLKEHATNSDEMGMYWKNVQPGYWWYQAPIETQAMLIEAFEKVTHDTTAVAAMKTWLLKNKQTNSWHTTKATADACYAMLLNGGSWLTASPSIAIQLGQTTVDNAQAEAGTGYFKKQFNNEAVKPAMGNIEVKVKGSNGQPSWGAIYWQYFEQLDKISSAATPMTLQKQLFIEQTNAGGPVLTAITDGNQLKVGDKVKSRIVMKVDRDMEYVHLKDMRGACFEPTNVISGSNWQNGVSYYESTKDASTNFFFSRLPKGTYVFEYTLFVTHTGNFSNGISTAQCMYAPEFSAHSEGIRVKVSE